MIEFLDTLFVVLTAFHVSVDGINKNIDVHFLNGFLGAAVSIQDVDVESVRAGVVEHFHLALMDETLDGEFHAITVGNPYGLIETP